MEDQRSHRIQHRGLTAADLGGLIIPIHKDKIARSFSRKEFCLPTESLIYKERITPELVLFLYDFSSRKLHGIFEAMDEPYTDRSSRVQVKFIITHYCHPLSQEQYEPVISRNYYTRDRFYLELTHPAKDKLISLFQRSPGISPDYVNLYEILQKSSIRRECEPLLDQPRIADGGRGYIGSSSTSGHQTSGSINVLKLVLQIIEKGQAMQEIQQKLREELDASKLQIRRLEDRILELESRQSGSYPSKTSPQN